MSPSAPRAGSCQISYAVFCTSPLYGAARRARLFERLERLLAADERPQALVLLAAGGAAVEVSAEAGDGGVGVLPGELELDVAVEEVEALVAADLRLRRAEEPAERLLQIGTVHRHLSSGWSSSANPRSCRSCRSFRRASCNVL